MRSIDQRLSKQRLRDYEIIYGEKRASLREVVERVLLQKVIALGAKIAYEMMCLQGSVKISTHVMTMLKRNLQAHNRILPIREFVREVKLHDPFMKLGCLDFGTKCIGTAATDETKQFTFPVGMIPVKQPPKTAESLVDLHRQLQEFSKKENIR